MNEGENQLKALLAPLGRMQPAEQLNFWRRFRAVHRKRIATTEAQLCPALLSAVDAQIAALKLQLTKV